MPDWEAVDFAIVGSGIAGLRAAVTLGREARVALLTKDAVSESATQYAQGGIAVAMGEDDTVALHERDTLAAGDGLASPAAVRVLVEEGPAAIAELLGWGASFDRDGERLQRTREAAHSRSRILHAHGDSTGREIADTLARHAAELPQIRWMPHRLASRLLWDGHTVCGVECEDWSRPGRPLTQVRAGAVLLASGGLGQLYADTTNPAVATGDGCGLAYRAGAVLQDMEFVQFHPTALALPGAPRFLLSEALRGEGAVLRNPAGERFMERYHPAAELAPRDVVARAIASELRAAAQPAAATCFLDATALAEEQLARRFPRITSTLQEYGLSLGRDWIPIRPAAHYAMGGVATDLDGRTSLPGLFAAGECACTGVHGANRLASNSLLEGLVFGARAGQAMLTLRGSAAGAGEPAPPPSTRRGRGLAEIQRIMSAAAGVVRHCEGLTVGLEALRAADESSLAATTAAAILRAALAREESRGAHFRTDYPLPHPALAGRHSRQHVGAPVWFASADEPLPAQDRWVAGGLESNSLTP